MFTFKHKSIQDFGLNANFFIGHEVYSEGSISTEDDIFIDGHFEGRIVTTGLVEIGKNAKVKAQINARALIVEGEFVGEAETKEEIILIRGSRTNANLLATEIETQRGSILNGKIETKE